MIIWNEGNGDGNGNENENEGGMNEYEREKENKFCLMLLGRLHRKGLMWVQSTAQGSRLKAQAKNEKGKVEKGQK